MKSIREGNINSHFPDRWNGSEILNVENMGNTKYNVVRKGV
jgi:hypothetical protein